MLLRVCFLSISIIFFNQAPSFAVEDESEDRPNAYFIMLKNKTQEDFITVVISRMDKILQTEAIQKGETKPLEIKKEFLSSTPPIVLYFLKPYCRCSDSITINKNTINKSYLILEKEEDTLKIIKEENQTT